MFPGRLVVYSCPFPVFWLTLQLNRSDVIRRFGCCPQLRAVRDAAVDAAVDVKLVAAWAPGAATDVELVVALAPGVAVLIARCVNVVIWQSASVVGMAAAKVLSPLFQTLEAQASCGSNMPSKRQYSGSHPKGLSALITVCPATRLVNFQAVCI